MLPTPVLPRWGVVDRIRPRVCDILPVVGLILYLQGAMLGDLCSEFGDAEADCCEVVASAFLDALCGGIHYIYGGLYCIIHVNHGQPCFCANEALIFASCECSIENTDRIICGSSSG